MLGGGARDLAIGLHVPGYPVPPILMTDSEDIRRSPVMVGVCPHIGIGASTVGVVCVLRSVVSVNA
jgi:hypothetical protein